jgi:triosephosphate isomerase
MRKKILAANWKMNLTHLEAESYVEAFLNEVGEVNDVEIVIVPSFTSIPTLAQASGNAPFIRLGAQNLHWEKSGAFTGEVSATMLRALFVKYVIIGHSERRALFGETDEIVQKKVHTALEAGLRPIMCVGETLAEREAGAFQKVLHRQVEDGLRGVAPVRAGRPLQRKRRKYTHFCGRCLPSSLIKVRPIGHGFSTAAVLNPRTPKS